MKTGISLVITLFIVSKNLKTSGNFSLLPVADEK
jgi:hypothetical protein